MPEMTVTLTAEEQRAHQARTHFFHDLPSHKVAWNFTEDTTFAREYIADHRARGAIVTARYWETEWQAVIEVTRPDRWVFIGVWNLFDKDDTSWWQQLGLSSGEVVPV